MPTFGERLRFRRNRLGWPQDDLAAKTGFSVSSITGWERGINPPNAQSLTKLAEVLSCDAGWLLIGSSQAGPSPPVDTLNEGAPGYAEDHISPPWIRDLVARLCSLSPPFRERAVRQFHLTLDQMISGKPESHHGRASHVEEGERSDDIAEKRALAGAKLAREQILGRRATPGVAPTTPEKGTPSVQSRPGKGP